MKTRYTILSITAALLLGGQAAAQSEAGAARELAAREAELKRNEAEIEKEMAEAEQRLAEAARQIAVLSTRRLPRIAPNGEFNIELMARPRLGVAIGGADEEDGPVEGVEIIGVTPGSAAEEAGLRTGDIVTSINGESLSAPSGREADRRLLDFMQGVEEGDELEIGYLRDGKAGKVELEPKVMDTPMFVFSDGSDLGLPVPPLAPGHRFHFAPVWSGNSWGDMELVELSERLGRYFGTDKGLLVVSAPKSDALKLEDGDVIQSIDGREPTSVGHALRILGSYQAGETLELTIMRDRKRQTLTIDMPADRRSMPMPFEASPAPAARRAPPPAPPPRDRT